MTVFGGIQGTFSWEKSGGDPGHTGWIILISCKMVSGGFKAPVVDTTVTSHPSE